MEIFPTIISAAGEELPEDVVYDGFNMLPVLQGKIKSPRNNMFWEFRGDFASGMGKWKWVDSKFGSVLFDLSEDIVKQHNLANSNPDILTMVKSAFKNLQKEMENAEPRGSFKDF